MGREFSYMITDRSPKRFPGLVGKNTTALSYAAEIAVDLNINLSGVASICHKDAVYTEPKSGPLSALTLQAQVTVVDPKERGIPEV